MAPEPPVAEPSAKKKSKGFLSSNIDFSEISVKISNLNLEKPELHRFSSFSFFCMTLAKLFLSLCELSFWNALSRVSNSRSGVGVFGQVHPRVSVQRRAGRPVSLPLSVHAAASPLPAEWRYGKEPIRRKAASHVSEGFKVAVCLQPRRPRVRACRRPRPSPSPQPPPVTAARRVSGHDSPGAETHWLHSAGMLEASTQIRFETNSVCFHRFEFAAAETEPEACSADSAF